MAQQTDYLVSLAQQYSISTFDQRDLELIQQGQISSDFSSGGGGGNLSFGDSSGDDLSFAKHGHDNDVIRRLRTQLSESDGRFNTLVQQHESECDALKRKLRDAQREKQQLQREFHAATSRLSDIVRVKEHTTVQQLERLQSRLHQLELEAPMLKQSQLLKANLRNLLVTPSQYEEIRAIDESRQTVREFVCQQVYELCVATKGDRQVLLAERDDLRERLEKSNREREVLQQKYDSGFSMWQQTRQALSDELEHVKVSYERVSTDYGELRRKYQDVEHHTREYESTRQRLDELTKENEHLQQQQLLNATSLKNMSSDRADADTRISMLQNQVSLLEADKKYLHKELNDSKEQRHGLQVDKDRLVAQLADMKTSRDQVMQQLMSTREEHKSTLETRLTDELHHLKLRTQQDLDDIRMNQREGYEREIRLLQEARDVAVQDRDRSAQQLTLARSRLATANDEHHKYQVQVDGKVQELRSELKMKTFELQRLNVVNEEQARNIERLRLEANSKHEKLSIVRSEYDRLELDMEKTHGRLMNEISLLKDKLAAYNQLEVELDEAIVSAGNDVDQEDGGTTSVGGGDVVASVGSSVVTANARRMKQSIHLAKQLTEKTKEAQTLRSEVQRLHVECGQLQQQLDTVEHTLKSVQQPHNFLISSLQQREEELEECRAQCVTLSSQLSESQCSYEHLQRQYDALEVDLTRMRSHEHSVRVVRRMIERLQPHEPPTNEGGTAAATRGVKTSNNDSTRCDNVPVKDVTPSPVGTRVQSPKSDKLSMCVRRDEDELSAHNPLAALLQQQRQRKVALNRSKHWKDRLNS